MPRILAFAALFALAPVAWAGPVSVVFDLQPPTVVNTAATIPVRLTATGGPADTIEVIQLSVAGSAPALTANGTDYSRFSFAPDPVGLPGWVELVPLSAGGLNLLAPADPLAGPFVTPSGTILLGTLTVDLTGLRGPQVVSLAGGAPGLGTDVGGTVDGALVPSITSDPAAGGVGFAQLDGVVATPALTGPPLPEPNPVPGPGGVVLLAVGAAGLLARKVFARKPAEVEMA